MSVLMSRRSFNIRKRQLIKRYGEYFEKARLELCPGWMGIIEETLDSIINLLTDSDKSKFNVLYIGHERESLRIIIEYPPEFSDARIEAANLIVNEASRSSRSVCEKCGSPLDRNVFGNHERCGAHPQFDGYFSDDYRAAELAKKEKEKEHVEGKKEETVVEGMDGLEADLKDKDQKRPTLQIYNVEEVLEIKKSLRQRTSDSDGRQRLQAICDNLIERGGERPYCELPEYSDEKFSVLAQNFPNFKETISEVQNAVALAKLGDGRLKLPHILLLGPPGVGKTMLAKEFANMFCTGYVEIHMESEQNGAAIAGSSEFWSNTQHGQIFDVLANGETANPFVVVDEVDKANHANAYDPLGGLYALLEPETAYRFQDQSMRGLKMNASGIMWILTANVIDNIPAPIRSRVHVYEVGYPTFDESMRIAKSIYRSMRDTNAWGPHFVDQLSDEVAELLAKHEPRKMRSLLLSAFGRAAIAKRDHLLPDFIPKMNGKMASAIGFLH